MSNIENKSLYTNMSNKEFVSHFGYLLDYNEYDFVHADVFRMALSRIPAEEPVCDCSIDDFADVDNIGLKYER